MEILNYFIWVSILIVVIYLFFKVLDILLQWATLQTISLTVHHKERVYYRNKKKSFYIIFTDKGSFKVVDTIAFLKFDASDRYARLHEDKTYTVTTTGYRSTLWSEYPNIINIK